MEQRILVTGGAGYIGSETVLRLKEQGFAPVVLDNLSRGNRDVIETLAVPFHHGELTDKEFCLSVLEKESPEAVIHFAALASVGESVTEPDLYYHNNVVGSLTLLDAMIELGIKRFIFSSTCATYGTPSRIPISEDTTQRPINPYGRSKLMVEHIIKDYASAFGLQYLIFRYFNAAGANSSAIIGERHVPETHLIPLALRATLAEHSLNIFGDDYETPDGTCIRDYVHVTDLADAHIRGVQWLVSGGESDCFNIGTGSGYSVNEVVRAITEVTGRITVCSVSSRREGDPPALIADATKIRRVLGWEPHHSDLKNIIDTAWQWHAKEWKERDDLNAPPTPA